MSRVFTDLIPQYCGVSCNGYPGRWRAFDSDQIARGTAAHHPRVGQTFTGTATRTNETAVRLARADSVQTRLASCAVAALVAKARRESAKQAVA